MRFTKHLRLLLILIFTIVLFNQIPQNLSKADGGIGRNFIFEQGTSDDYVEDVYDNTSFFTPSYELASHWSPASTATGDGSAAQGESLTLTWSIIPDGTAMPAQGGEDTTCNSSLIADLNTVYGVGNWQAEIENVFNDWSSKTGNNYVRELNDDGAAWPTSIGVLGTRGDIRIGGCTIDGNSGILGYNFFPNNGDMKIDSKDSFYTASNLTTSFHNIISHEHGHGAGIEHVCPVNQTKLMEPFLTTAFKGLQHDDIRAIQRHYGDFNELIGVGNDAAAQATLLGTPPDNVTTTMSQVSIDDNSDTDWYSFMASHSVKKVTLSVTPVGSTYLSGPQFNNGSCSAGSSINTLAIHNLTVELIDSDQTTVIATGNSNGTGLAETLTEVALGAAGTKYIRVTGDSTNDLQLYDLQLVISNRVPNFATTVTSDPTNIKSDTDLITYTLSILNNGDEGTNVLLTNTIPASTTYIMASDSGTETTSGSGVITWPTISNFAASVTISRTFLVSITQPLTDGNSLTNIVSADADFIDPVTQAFSQFVNEKFIYFPILFKD
ncbi:MAG: matrixin family metalloprotease [Chloroflexota bacterium]